MQRFVRTCSSALAPPTTARCSSWASGALNARPKAKRGILGTFGAGLKIFAKNVGLRLGAQWTPTYIKTDSAGWWCDPYWGCYVVGDARYSNQFQLNAGVTLRF